jgi:hypothetical protein
VFLECAAKSGKAPCDGLVGRSGTWHASIRG